MKTVVLKFGGSSLADNIKLNIVAKKIIEFYEDNNNVVAVVSAQGKTTDRLIKEAKELSNLPDERELDVLLSTGEQVSMSKLSILLNRLGYSSVSLTGWQAGIVTNDINQNAKINYIDTTRIKEELDKKKIVIISGFQGINNNCDITTLGRGGSDTSAVAIASALNADHCYIFSDVDGIYSTDPNKITIAKKLETISYDEMLEMSNEGAKVLHNRCIEVGKKYNLPIVARSTFNNNKGTTVNDKIEDTSIKSIVKNDNIIFVNMKKKDYDIEIFYNIINELTSNIEITNLQNNSNKELDINFIIKSTDLTKFQNMLECSFKEYQTSYINVSRIAIVGYGIMNNNTALHKILDVIENNQLEVINLDISSLKICITFKNLVSNDIVEQLHKELI